MALPASRAVHFDVKPLNRSKATQSTTKITAPKTGDFQKKCSILTLVDDVSAHSVNKANAVSFDLKANPAEADSSTHKQMFRMLAGGETIRQILRWKSNDGASVAPLSVNLCFCSLTVPAAVLRFHRC